MADDVFRIVLAAVVGSYVLVIGINYITYPTWLDNVRTSKHKLIRVLSVARLDFGSWDAPRTYSRANRYMMGGIAVVLGLIYNFSWPTMSK